ncbi:MAG: DNA polymerase III subunit delta [Candidatus Desantisbacteria bacterium]
MIAYKHFLSELKKSELLPVYLLAGPEEYLKEECVKNIKGRLFTPGEEIEFNFQVIYGDNSQAATIINACKAMPFGAKKRLVIVKDFSKLSKEAKAQLTPYLKSPTIHTCLILITEKIEKDVGPGGCQVVNFYPLYESELNAWIGQQLQKYKKKIHPDASHLLISKAGTGLLELSSEIEKLCLFVGKKECIEAIDVTEVVSNNREANIFELMDTIGQKKSQQAIKVLNDLLSQKEEPVKILFMITRHLRNIFKLKLLQKQGIPLPQIWKTLKINWPIQQSSLLKQAEFHQEQDLRNAFNLLLETDISLKSQDPKLYFVVMEVLVFRLCQRG